MKWYQLEFAAALRELGVDAVRGLGEDEIARRRLQHGRNELEGTGVRSPWKILWEQLSALMMVVLIAAAAISALLADYKDAAAIGAIVLLNAALGFTQEYRAEQAMAALRRLSVPVARVLRNGVAAEIPSDDLLPGDMLFLEAGNFVAADGRLIECANLQTQEAALTGESEPVLKTVSAITAEALALGDRRNMVFRGTYVTAGRGVLVVTETGMRTELGRIAAMIEAVTQEPTPLQKRLEHLGKRLAAAALAIVALIFILGVLRGEDLHLMLLTAVSIGVAAVPEGLPAVVTIALTLGAQRMLKRRVLVRRLGAVETLGSVTVICSDKTGTLTENRMTAETIHAAGVALDVRGAEDAPDAVGPLLRGGVLCNDAGLAIGDPTEVALVAVAAKFGIDKCQLDSAMPRIGEVPFDSGRKRMTTVHSAASDVFGVPPSTARVAITKGAVDALLSQAEGVWANGAITPMDAEWRERIARANDDLARKGMRVLGVAFRFVEDNEEIDHRIERGLTMAGLVGIVDPPRREAADAVATCQRAGIRAVMITGDHPLTAAYVASQLGIGDGRVVTGAEIERGGELVESAAIYARVSPAHKLKIVEHLQGQEQIVAMTGDGVNDAPALKRADIGIAMGVTGTDVAKEAADMVLLDDNFATIVAAVEEGRVIYDNVRKFIKYILATNAGEIWLMLLAPLAGMPIPLLPLQLLWLNLVTDGLPALALGVEPAEENVMRRPPQSPRENIFSRGLGVHVLWVGMLMGLLALGAGYWNWRHGNPNWQTILFTTLTFSQMAHVLAIRSERRSLFQLGLLSNKALLGAVLVTFVLQVCLIYLGFAQEFFRTKALPVEQFALTLGLSAIVFAAVETEKWMARRRALD